MGHGRYVIPTPGLVLPDHGSVIPSPEGASVSQYEVPSGEVLELEFLVLPGESRDINVFIDLIGPGAEARIRGLYLCGSDEKVNFRILMHHRAPGCKSTQLIKGIAGGSSRVNFDGTIVVAPDAQGTEAYQENHNIVLTPDAHVETRPQLEIYADDVKCSHGATVGRLSEDELFYMRSRGIPLEEARTLQMLSFLAPVIPPSREDEIAACVGRLVFPG